MTMSPAFRDHLLDLLAPLGPVGARRMFGGGGLFLDGSMFGLVADDVLYLKTDDGNRAAFEDAGMGPFMYDKAGKQVAMSYHEAPDHLMEDEDEMIAWARAAWEAARRSGTKKKAKPKKKPANAKKGT